MATAAAEAQLLSGLRTPHVVSRVGIQLRGVKGRLELNTLQLEGGAAEGAADAKAPLVMTHGYGSGLGACVPSSGRLRLSVSSVLGGEGGAGRMPSCHRDTRIPSQRHG